MYRARRILSAVVLLCCLLAKPALASPWVSADWGGAEPSYPPGSLFWHTNEYSTCPVLFRTVLDVRRAPVAYAGFEARASRYAYVFLNGRQIAEHVEENKDVTGPFSVELTHLLRPGRNVLVVSTASDGLALDGGIAYEDGRLQRFGTDPASWRVQKFPPVTMLEYEPAMRPDFDDSAWHPVAESDREPLRVSDAKLKQLCASLASERLHRWDEDAEWRLQMLAAKGIAVVDWETHGWAGPERLPSWVRDLAARPEPAGAAAGSRHQRAEALCRYVVLSDEATNLENQAVGLEALKEPSADVEACREAARAMRSALGEAEQAMKAGRFDESLLHLDRAKAASDAARSGRLLNDLNWSLDNKFSWFDSGALLDNRISDWGLRIGSPASTLASPLSPAALVTLEGAQLTLEGWDAAEPYRVYDKPAVLGPVCAWAVLGGRVTSLWPDDHGVVYDRAAQGPLSENWVLLVEAMNRGGRLPVQLVFLDEPERIVFERSEKGTSRVTVAFQAAGARLFVLRPLKEWRGFLEEARLLTADPVDQEAVQPYLRACRLWSRALLDYPITFSESFIRDPQDEWALYVADVYNYRELRDAWGTEPLRLAPLPPLATYGLLVDYPGLRVVGNAEVLGSRGIWGDEIAAVGQDHIVYRVPLDPIKRFGGFTSYCFGPTDIGQPGNIPEIESVARTGANSYRPQHNQTGDAAMKTLDWCWERGIQNVFNADEKWVTDIVEHYRTLAQKCKDYPFDAVAYDLLNEPETREPRAYNTLIRRVVKAIRAIDKTHLIYVEVIPEWGPGARPYPEAAFDNLENTGDPLTCYSFHDYRYRLPPRWPNAEDDIRDILTRWVPAFRASIDYRAPIHLGEFGGFEQTDQSVFENSCALTLMLDYLRIFDQFGWHWHYYSNRGIVYVRADGSLRESYVQDACRRYFATGRFNANRTSPAGRP